MPYRVKGKCIYKKDTGKKVGCTKGSVKKYLGALYANVPDAKNENEELNMENKHIKLSEMAKKVMEDYRGYSSQELHDIMSTYEGLWDDFSRTDEESSDENLYRFLKSRRLV